MSMPVTVATYPYRVKAETAAEATEKAKATARAEGYTIKTVASCRPAATAGQWVVRLTVKGAS